MNSRYSEYARTLIESVLNGSGETSSELRQAVAAQSARLSGRSSQEAEPIPTNLEQYVEKVALHAYKVTDEDVDALRTSGYSENAIFEITVSAALGAGMARLERGLAILKGAGDATRSA